MHRRGESITKDHVTTAQRDINREVILVVKLGLRRYDSKVPLLENQNLILGRELQRGIAKEVKI